GPKSLFPLWRYRLKKKDFPATPRHEAHGSLLMGGFAEGAARPGGPCGFYSNIRRPQPVGGDEPRRHSELETKSSRRSKIVGEEEATRQSVVDFRVHEASVGIELLRELPINVDRNCVHRTR